MTRKEAMLNGVLTYTGRPHTCGTTIKYTKGRNCVECKQFKRPEQRRQRRDYYQSLRQAALQHYSDSSTPRCFCCHENILMFLQLDHIENDGNIHRKNLTKTIWSWLKRNGYPHGFQVLCANCNIGKSINGGFCPHAEIKRII